MPRPRGEAEPLPPVRPPPPSSVTHLCVSHRCVTATGTVTVTTAGRPPSVSSRAMVAAWTAAPRGTVPPSASPRGSRDLGRAKPRTRCDVVPACRGRTGTVLCVLTSVCCPQIKTRLSGMDSWSSSSWCCLYSLWVPLFTCAGTTCFGASGCTAGGGHRRTSECDVMVQSPASQLFLVKFYFLLKSGLGAFILKVH